MGMATQVRPAVARRTPPFRLLPHPPASQPMGTQPVSLSTPSPRLPEAGGMALVQDLVLWACRVTRRRGDAAGPSSSRRSCRPAGGASARAAFVWDRPPSPREGGLVNHRCSACSIVAPRRSASLDTFFVAVKPSSSALRIGLSLINS